MAEAVETGVGRVVVGFDGSESAARALRWGRAEADRWHVPLVVVNVWEFSPLVAATRASTNLDELQEGAELRARREVADLIGDEAAAAAEFVVRQGAATEVILEQLLPNDLLVVGSRGLSALKRMVLGSVSHQLVLEAPCPVVILRDDHHH